MDEPGGLLDEELLDGLDGELLPPLEGDDDELPPEDGDDPEPEDAGWHSGWLPLLDEAGVVAIVNKSYP